MDYLMKLRSGGMKPGLDRMNACLRLLNLDFTSNNNAATFVHVVGSNGKGTIAAKVSHGLQYYSMKPKINIGLFTSPHISTIRERFLINGQMVSQAEFSGMADKMQQRFSIMPSQNQPTYFEAMTLMALMHFEEKKCQFIVLEAGLGGQFDATNFDNFHGTRRLCILSNISLEHTSWLGTTLEEICRNKAGIIQVGSDVIVGPQFSSNQKLTAIVHDTCLKRKAGRLIHAKSQLDTENIDDNEINTIIAKTAVGHILQRDLTMAEIDGMRRVTLPCRFEQFGINGKNVILDVAHNPAALRNLSVKLLESLKNEKNVHLTIIFGLSSNKDVTPCIQNLFEYIINPMMVSHLDIIFTMGSVVERSTDPTFLLNSFKINYPAAIRNMRISISKINDASEAFENAIIKDKQHAKHVILVCGSFFLMDKIRRRLYPNSQADISQMNEAQV